ncbi:MAG: hypothetical protein KF791_04760 [Verrucomicrobiae bacterium]|nr:hypothetical protein [Verrucomicrobiae bacterium]
MNPRALSALLPVLMSLPAFAADPPAAKAPATADAAFARFVEALGGEKAVREQTTRQTKGRLSVPAMGLEGNIEMLQSAPRRTLQVIEVAPGMTLSMGSDGTVAWMTFPGIGAQEIEGEQRQNFIEDADIFRMLELPKRYSKSETKGSQKLDDVEVDLVVGTTPAGRTETLYFSRADGLLRRWDRQILTQAGSWEPGETWLEDYRAVDGIQVPFKIRQPKPESGAFEIVVSEVKHGVPAPAERFRKPTE